MRMCPFLKISWKDWLEEQLVSIHIHSEGRSVQKILARAKLFSWQVLPHWENSWLCWSFGTESQAGNDNIGLWTLLLCWAYLPIWHFIQNPSACISETLHVETEFLG